MIEILEIAAALSVFAMVCTGVLIWVSTWPPEKPDQWRKYKGVMRLREDNEREAIVHTAELVTDLSKRLDKSKYEPTYQSKP